MTTYERHEGEEIEATNIERLTKLQAAGLQLNGLGEHYMMALVEQVAEALEVKDLAFLAHQKWLADLLEKTEAQALEAARKHQAAQLEAKWGVVGPPIQQVPPR